MNILKKLFDWNNHPIRILFILIPIVILKFGYLLAYSVAQINVNNNCFPLAITVLGFITLIFCVSPLFKIIRESEAKKKLNKNTFEDKKN